MGNKSFPLYIMRTVDEVFLRFWSFWRVVNALFVVFKYRILSITDTFLFKISVAYLVVKCGFTRLPSLSLVSLWLLRYVTEIDRRCWFNFFAKFYVLVNFLY